MIVDNVWNPKIVYVIADGIGDFFRSLSENEIQRIGRLQKILENFLSLSVQYHSHEIHPFIPALAILGGYEYSLLLNKNKSNLEQC